MPVHLLDAQLQTAWNVTTGRPDVVISVLDSGIRWDDAGAMTDLRHKLRLNTESCQGRNADRVQPLEAGVNCAAFQVGGGRTPIYDANGDGVNVTDYACDSRVTTNGGPRAGPGDALCHKI